VPVQTGQTIDTCPRPLHGEQRVREGAVEDDALEDDELEWRRLDREDEEEPLLGIMGCC
jgi:hypothetical protein